MALPARPGWDRAAATFIESATAVSELVATIADLDRPGIGEWTVGELASHTLRAVAAPQRYGAEPEPEAVDLGDAASYFAAYLDWRAEDPTAADAAVAARARHQATDPRPTWPPAVAAAREYLAGADPERKLATPFGSIRLIDYLPTRTVELVIHGLDLAAALDILWAAPQAGATTTLAVLTALSLRRDHAGTAIGLLCGRDWARVPVLR